MSDRSGVRVAATPPNNTLHPTSLPPRAFVPSSMDRWAAKPRVNVGVRRQDAVVAAPTADV